MAPDESDCENFNLETSYKLYFNLKRWLRATEHPPNKISDSSLGVFFSRSRVTGQWQLISHAVALGAMSPISSQSPWSSFKFLNQLHRSVSHIWFTFQFTLKTVLLNPDKKCPQFLVVESAPHRHAGVPSVLADLSLWQWQECPHLSVLSD